MKLIDKNITDIIPGYDEILQAETDLRNRWRPQLLAAYTQRRIIEEGESNRSLRQQIKTLISVLLGAGFLLIGIGFSWRGVLQIEENTLWYCCGGPLLFLLGFLILGASWLSRKSSRTQTSKRIPLHPLRSGSENQAIYPDLRTAWMTGLCGVLEEEVPDFPEYFDDNEKDHGAQGERLFIQRLHEIFDDRSFVLARLMVRPKEDVDVILIGPKGIWVFEVKRWSGEIFWDDQGWRRVQTYYERGGVEVTKQPKIGEPPDQQWIRAASQVRRTLQSQGADVLVRYPALEKVRGGIVFSKEDAVLQFQPGRPVYWGTLNFWMKTLHNLEPKEDLDMRSTLELVDILLARHHDLAPIQQTRSMQDYALGVVQDAEEQLNAWVRI